MNVKKSLGSRIRGWFPQEPKFPKTLAKIDFPMKPQPLPLNQKPEGIFSATKGVGFLAIFWIFIEVINIIEFNKLDHLSLTSQIGWIVPGIIFGFILTSIFSQGHLSNLQKITKLALMKKTYAFLLSQS